MAAKTVCLPTKVLCVVEASAYIRPIGLGGIGHVGICRHSREGKNTLFVRHVRTGDLVDSPGVGGEDDLPPGQTLRFEDLINSFGAPVCKALDVEGLRASAEARGGLPPSRIVLGGDP